MLCEFARHRSLWPQCVVWSALTYTGVVSVLHLNLGIIQTSSRILNPCRTFLQIVQKFCLILNSIRHAW